MEEAGHEAGGSFRLHLVFNYQQRLLSIVNNTMVLLGGGTGAKRL